MRPSREGPTASRDDNPELQPCSLRSVFLPPARPCSPRRSPRPLPSPKARNESVTSHNYHDTARPAVIRSELRAKFLARRWKLESRASRAGNRRSLHTPRDAERFLARLPLEQGVCEGKNTSGKFGLAGKCSSRKFEGSERGNIEIVRGNRGLECFGWMKFVA